MSLAALWSRRNGPEYHKVGNEASDDPESQAGFTGNPLIGSTLSMPRFGRWSLKGLLAVGGGFFVLLLLATAGHSQLKSADDPAPSTPTESAPSTPTEPVEVAPEVFKRKIRLIAPADQPGTNLCKMLLSGYANGYPATVIANWKRDFAKGTGGFDSSHLGKIDGSLEAIEGLSDPSMPEDERLSDDDLVFIIDAYDVWLQLPPETLIQRYYAEIARANKRLAEEWHADAPGASDPPKLDIILSTQKKCWPTEADGHATKCSILPDSTLRADLYGPNTDKENLHDIRPKYINSGSIIGSVGGMKRYFQSAKKIVNDAAAEGQSFHSDQGVLGTILGAQEAWRKQERELNARAAKGEDISGVKREWNASSEYSLGLDYIQDLFKPTVFEEDDGLYMVLSDADTVRNKSEEAGVMPSRIQGLPTDLQGIAKPLEVAGIRDIRDEDDDENPNWADVPLYTDFWSEVVTVAVHHNAHRGGMKNRRLREWWNKNWFFPYLREVAELSEQPRPLKAITQVENEGQTLEFWAPPADAKKTLPRIFNKANVSSGLDEADWNTLCHQDGITWWEVIFQDKKGWKGQ